MRIDGTCCVFIFYRGRKLYAYSEEIWREFLWTDGQTFLSHTHMMVRSGGSWWVDSFEGLRGCQSSGTGEPIILKKRGRIMMVLKCQHFSVSPSLPVPVEWKQLAGCRAVALSHSFIAILLLLPPALPLSTSSKPTKTQENVPVHQRVRRLNNSLSRSVSLPLLSLRKQATLN